MQEKLENHHSYYIMLDIVENTDFLKIRCLRLLKVSEGALELIDCSKTLEGFDYAPGFTNWKVFGNDMNEYYHYEQVPEALKYGRQIHCGMFPDDEFNKKNNLDFCLRMLPHHNNDGGFFAAMLKKVKPLPWEKEHRTVNRFSQFSFPRKVSF